MEKKTSWTTFRKSGRERVGVTNTMDRTGAPGTNVSPGWWRRKGSLIKRCEDVFVKRMLYLY